METSERTERGATIGFKSSEQLIEETPAERRPSPAPSQPEGQPPGMPELAEGGVKVFKPTLDPERLPQNVTVQQMVNEVLARAMPQPDEEQ